MMLAGGGKWGENVPWSHMEKTDVANAVEAVFERCKGGALREEHKDAVEAFVEVGVAFWFEELETQVWLLVSVNCMRANCV